MKQNWNVGKMERWVKEEMRKNKLFTNSPVFHHSIIPEII